MSDIGHILQLNRVNPRTGQVEAVPAIERVNAILDHPEAQEIVRQLDPQSLHALVQEAGIEDASDLVLMASPEQIQSLVDYSVWTRDEVDLERITEWLALLLQMPDRDLERTLSTLDPEIIPLWLRNQVGVLFWEHDTELIDALDAPLISSPDGVHALVVPDEERLGPVIRLLLERLYAIDIKLGLQVLGAVRWELTAQMQETAWQARQARLADQGFVPFEEAVEAIAWLDPVLWRRRILERARAPETTPLTFTSGSLPVLDTHLQHLEAEQLSGAPTRFTRALGAIGQAFGPDRVERVADAVLSQFRALVNRVHIAASSDPGDMAAARQSMLAAERRLSLALDVLAGEDQVLGARVLGTSPLILIHRLAHSMVVQLARQAHVLNRRGNLALIDRPFSLLREEDRDALAGLLLADPRMSETLGTPFTSAVDIEQVARRLGRIAAVEVMLFEHASWSRDGIVASFGSGPGTPVELLTVDALVSSTLLSARVMDGPIALSESAVRAHLKAFGTVEEVQACLLDRADGWLHELGITEAPLRPLLSSWLGGVVAQLGDGIGNGAPCEMDREVLLQVFAVSEPESPA